MFYCICNAANTAALRVARDTFHSQIDRIDIRSVCRFHIPFLHPLHLLFPFLLFLLFDFPDLLFRSQGQCLLLFRDILLFVFIIQTADSHQHYYLVFIFVCCARVDSEPGKGKKIYEGTQFQLGPRAYVVWIERI